MKQNFFKTIIVIFFSTFVSCGLNNNGNIEQKDSLAYYQQEAEKNNINDTIFAGFSFAMDSLSAVQHAIEDSNIWNTYGTQYGRERVYIFNHGMDGYNVDYGFCQSCIYWSDYDMKIKEEYETMAEYSSKYSPLDYYPYHSAYTTKVVLIEDDSTYSEEYVHFGLSYYNSHLFEITMTFHGRRTDSQYDVQSEPLFNAVVKTFQTKYGKPYIKERSKAIWVNGITHITAYYYGVEYCHDKEFTDEGWVDCSKYYPVVIVKYTNYPLTQEYKRKLEKQIQNEDSAQASNKEREQNELKNRFNNSNRI